MRADCIVLDVSAEVEAQAEAERQAAMARKAQKFESLGQLTGGVAHDFNNLLAVILGSLELLDETAEDPLSRELIAPAIQAAQRGAGLTRSLLAFARKARLDPKACDLNALVEETIGWAARTIPSNIRIETALAGDLWQVDVDVDATSSAVLNLLLNARDAMPAGGRITLSTENLDIGPDRAAREDLQPGRYVRLCVRDTGTGMAPEVAARIFEPFFTTKEQGKGTGLGLAMVEGFIKQSGGTIQVASEPGAGTDFILYFPARVREGSIATGAAEAAGSPCAGCRVLVAEDQPGVLLVIKAMLERAGCTVTPAGSGDVALELFRDGEFDLLLTDIVMPGRLMGPALAAEIRKRVPGLPVIFMSGYAADSAIRGSDLQPTDIRLAKPVSRSELLSAIGRAMADRCPAARPGAVARLGPPAVP
ncbi:ATP-binding protein [Mangrovicoccus ximenensis]|uniref:ATP-binding protein n=1 Tax=Mangrovicoccus ximenensis TaxID=1911570 RepID=UPI002ED2EC52